MTKIQKTLFGFIVAGLLFSFYLAGTKFLSDTCAFNAPCPYFLGYPACYTGFLIYLALLITFVLYRKSTEIPSFYIRNLQLLGFVGVLFSGKFTLAELPIWFNEGFVAFVGSLPLCSIGFVFFVIITILSMRLGKGNKNNA